MGGVTLNLIENKTRDFFISPGEWMDYEYAKPPLDVNVAEDLVEKKLMSEDQLSKIYWGPEEKDHPDLKGQVAFFGTYTKKK